MKTKFLYFILIILSEFVFSQNPVKFETQVNSLGKDKFELVTNATIEKGWRLYSQNLPKGGAIPTEFIFDNSSSFDLLGSTKESKSISKFDPIFNMEQTYFEFKSTFTQKILLLKEIETINVKIAYHACDDIVCIFREADLIFNIDGSKLEIENEDLTSLVFNENNPLYVEFKDKELLSTVSDSSNSFSSNSYFNLMILGFIGGLLALLTPCVFPMIPLTVSFFSNSSSKSNSKFNAFLYGFFIIVDEVLKAFVYDVSKELSVFVGLIITNCIVMGRLEAFALANSPYESFLDGLGNSFGYGWILIAVAFFRELFGAGTLYGYPVLEKLGVYELGYENNGMMILPPMALVTVGIIIWIQRMKNRDLIES